MSPLLQRWRQPYFPEGAYCWGEYAWEMKAAFLAAGAICILLAFFLLREPVMDISYLDSPRETRLEQVSFGSSQLGDGSVRYYLEGRGTEGDHLFSALSREEYDEGCGLRQENPDIVSPCGLSSSHGCGYDSRVSFRSRIKSGGSFREPDSRLLNNCPFVWKNDSALCISKNTIFFFGIKKKYLKIL